MGGDCCVCGHPLKDHVDEGDGWRCHCLGPDTYQCECWLRRDRAEGDIKYYDLDRRAVEALDELRGRS
jgi:hypothetical protein